MGCRGIYVTGHTACLAHLEQAGLNAYLDTLHPGADIDHRGTHIEAHRLNQILDKLRDTTGQPNLGDARFDGAAFSGYARFGRVTFTGQTSFRRATFSRYAWFDGVTFTGDALFGGVTFTGDARFDRAAFTGDAVFVGVAFSGDARFDRAAFTGNAVFVGVAFSGDALFGGARFEAASRLGPLVCGGTVDLSGAVFGVPVMVEVAAAQVLLLRTRWESTAALRLRYAEVDLAGAVLEYPVTLAAEPTPFPDAPEDWADELASAGPGVRISSVSGVDAAHLTLIDVDLTSCRFAGAVHLDQLRIDGRTTFDRPPAGWHRRGPLPVRWSRRRVLAEEQHWRAAVTGGAGPGPGLAATSWRPGPHHPGLTRTPGPETIAALYRQLRKALEDGKNEPGAADFYYGECEMRRHDTTGTARAERWLLAVYWAVSGYGLRASRALAWLGAAMAATVVALMLWGIPADDPKPTTAGRQVETGRQLALTTDRFEKALRVVINSTVFRSSGQNLTTTGTYTEMTSRFTEPVLLTLAVLAVRARVKR